MTPAWLRGEGLTYLEPVPGPITTPRGFRRRKRRHLRRREPRVIFRDVSVRSSGGLSIVVGPGAATAAVAAVLAGVTRPTAGAVETSHRPVPLLRARGRLIVDLRVRSVILRELRLRGISAAVGREIMEETCRIAGVDPSQWVSDLDREVYSRLAPAAVVCSDAPVLILDGVFPGQSPEFDEALLQRLAARSRRFDLVTILCAAERRGVDELVGALEVQQMLSLPRALAGNSASDPPLPDEDDDEENDDADVYGLGRRGATALAIAQPARDIVTFDDVRYEQFGAEADTIDGRQPFTIRIAVTSVFDGPAKWSLRLVHGATAVVVAAAEGSTEPDDGVSTLVLRMDSQTFTGKLVVNARVEGLVGGERYVVVEPTVGIVPVTIGGDEASDAVVSGQLSFAP